MKILFCVNWAVARLDEPDLHRFCADYISPVQPYWFFRHLCDRHTVDVIDFRGPFGLHRLERSTVRCFPYQSVKAFLRERRYDVVLSHGAQTGLVHSLMSSLIGRNRPPHFLFDVGALNGGSANPAAVAACRFAFRSLAGLIYHSSGQAQHYRAHFPELYARSRFIPLGVDAGEFAPQGEATEDQIICVGYAKRDWTTLLEAYSALRTKTRLVLLGMPQPHDPLPQGVMAVPRVNIAEMRQWIARSRFVVLPIPDTPYSVGQQTLLQSMALGKAVVASDIPALRDYAADAMTACFYRPGDAGELTERMAYLLERPDVADDIGRCARQHVINEFSESLMASRIMEFVSQAA
ncbi:MAG: glycosyltransferase family 4 protein [Terracidiphilus sp.]|jgi:glycosyltransferase involved in cell wall biosynthesis